MRVRIGNLSTLAALLLAACTDRGPTLPRFNAAGGSSGPSVKSAEPDNAPQDTTLDVAVSGSGFDRGSTAQWAIAAMPSSKVRTNSTRFVSPKQLVANITIALDADPVLYDIVVTTATGKKGIGTEMFAVRSKGVGHQAPSPELSFNRNGAIWVMSRTGTKLFQVSHDTLTGFVAASSWAPGGNGMLGSPYRIAYTGQGQGWPLRVVDIDTIGGVVTASNDRRVFTSEPPVHFAWSPLGDSIVLADGAPEGSYPSDLHLVAPDGSGEHAIYSAPDSEIVRWPAWSGDGRFIAFVQQPSLSGGSSRYQTRGDAIKVLDVVTRVVTLVVQLPPNTIARDLDWARTRTAIAYATQLFSCSGPPKNCVTKVLTQELDASMVPVGSSVFIANGQSPSWSPDDGALVFSDGTVKRYEFGTGQITPLSTGLEPDWRR